MRVLPRRRTGRGHGNSRNLSLYLRKSRKVCDNRNIVLRRILSRFGYEHRSAGIDPGALYQSLYFGSTAFGWSQSPGVIATALSVPDGLGSLLTDARRLARTPLIQSYLRCITGSVLTGEPEAPTFPEGVPARTATAAASLWTAHHDPDLEYELLHRFVVDGELIILPDGTVVPADGYEPETSGPDWRREVVGYRLGKSKAVRRDVLYVGDRRDGHARAVSWIGPALPFVSALYGIRIAAGHGLSALARIASIIENTSPDRLAATPAGRSGVIAAGTGATAGTDTDRQDLTRVGLGSVVYMRQNEALKRAQVGPDAAAREYEAQLEMDVASALNLPLGELKSDYSTGSFSNLRMSWTDAEREYARRRHWWHRHYRLPLWRELLDEAFAAGSLPRMNREVLMKLRSPTWPGPKREPPQPEGEAKALKMLVDAGILSPAAAAAQLDGDA